MLICRQILVRALLALWAISALTACGQTGPLYLPQKAKASTPNSASKDVTPSQTQRTPNPLPPTTP